MNTCPTCGHIIPDPKPNPPEPNPRQIIFICNGERRYELGVPYNDAFYQIISGRFNGNLVHITDIVNLWK